MDSVEETETTKRHNKSFYSLCLTILSRFGIVTIIFACTYFFFPSSLEAIKVCIDWGPFIMNCFIVLVIAITGAIIFYQQYWIPSKTVEEKAKLYDEYVANRTSPEYNNNYRVTEVEDDYNNNSINNSSYKEIAPVFEAVKECNYYGGRAAVEEVESKSYRRTRLERKMEKKGMRMMEYQRTELERVSKTASWRSETMDGLSSEECRMSVETFITEKKKMLFWQSCGVDQWQHGGVDMWRNGGFDRRQNVQWPNHVPHLQNGSFDQWQNGGVPQLQNGAVGQWQNGMVPWQGSPDDGSGGHRHQSRSQRPYF